MISKWNHFQVSWKKISIASGFKKDGFLYLFEGFRVPTISSLEMKDITQQKVQNLKTITPNKSAQIT